MLSIGAASGGYYASLAHEDYYHNGGEPPGLWHGRGCSSLGLDGQVDKDIFLKLCDGFSPGGLPLTQNAGKENHRAGYDLTFSAPKSVSVLWSQADPETRREIQAAQIEAVKKALDYLEQEATYTRRGKGGVELEKCGLIVATFEHGTSRAQDPQLHTHAVALNIGIRGDGTTGTLESKPLFRHKMAAGAIYRAELAHQLEQQIGVEIEAGKKDTFEIKGVPEKLTTEFSKRHEQIEAAMKSEGARGAERAAYFTLTTREKKAHVAREVLFEKWQDIGREHGLFPETVINCPSSHLCNRETLDKGTVVEKAAGRITETQAYFSEKDLVRRTAEAAQTRGMSAENVLSAVGKYLEREAVHLGRIGNERYYTTREIDALEKQMLSQVMGSSLITHEAQVSDAVRVSPTLNDEQRKALYHVTHKEGSIQVISGMAGTGKTTLLASAREVWEAQGFTVEGAALAAVAAKGLEEGAGIKSRTIARLLMDIDRAEEYAAQKKAPPSAEEKKQERQAAMREIYAEYKQATWQWSKETKEKYLGQYYEPTSQAKHEFLYATWQISKKHRDSLNSELGKEQREKELRSPLNEKTVLVIDEAGMVGTRQMARLIDEVSKAGARLILVGDEKQLQPIEHGAPFKAIGDRLGRSELTDIKRQRDEWAREAVKDFAFGRAEQGLKIYAERGLLTVTETRRDAMRELIRDWSKSDESKYQERLIVAGMKAEVSALNRMAQEERQRRGELGAQSLEVNAQTFYERDRVLFTKNNKAHGVHNGDLGTIVRVSPVTGDVVVKLDGGERVIIPTRSYENIDLGYAITTHKGQGKTVEKAFILAGGSMQDRELSYVQMSRTRGETRIYTERADAGDTITELSREMNKSRQKEMAHQLAERLIEQSHKSIIERTL